MGLKVRGPVQESIRPLKKHEIDRRIERLVADVAALAGEEDRDPGTETDPFRPRWITAAELVRRMRPFIVLN